MEYFPLILLGDFQMHFLMSPTTNPAAVADTDFLHSWEGGDPTILYNITGVWVKWFIF